MLGKTLVYVFPTTIYSHIRTFSLPLCISLCDSFDVGIPKRSMISSIQLQHYFFTPLALEAECS